MLATKATNQELQQLFATTTQARNVRLALLGKISFGELRRLVGKQRA